MTHSTKSLIQAANDIGPALARFDNDTEAFAFIMPLRADKNPQAPPAWFTKVEGAGQSVAKAA